MNTKKWYQSKLVVLGLAITLVYGSNALLGWLSGSASVEQIQAIEETRPEVLDIVNRLKNGENILNVIGSVAGVIIVIVRVWFTDKLLPQSLKK